MSRRRDETEDEFIGGADAPPRDRKTVIYNNGNGWKNYLLNALTVILLAIGAWFLTRIDSHVENLDVNFAILRQCVQDQTKCDKAVFRGSADYQHSPKGVRYVNGVWAPDGYY